VLENWDLPPPFKVKAEAFEHGIHEGFQRPQSFAFGDSSEQLGVEVFRAVLQHEQLAHRDVHLREDRRYVWPRLRSARRRGCLCELCIAVGSARHHLSRPL